MTEPDGDGLVDLVDRRVPDRDLPRPETARSPVVVSCGPTPARARMFTRYREFRYLESGWMKLSAGRAIRGLRRVVLTVVELFDFPRHGVLCGVWGEDERF